MIGKKFNETSLPKKGDFYSHFNMKDITDAVYAHARKSLQRFWNKKFGGISWFGDTLLLADVFENFRNMSLGIYELDSAKFLSDPCLAWA